MDFKWTKSTGDVWSATVGPFKLKIQPKGDGRWSWEIFNGPGVNPAATGVGNSLGAAKTVTQQYVMRSGLV